MVFTGRAHGDLQVDGDPATLAARRRAVVDLPWTWLRQVHGAAVVTVGTPGEHAGAEADAAVTATTGAALAVHTADCAPVVLLGEGAVGVVHAGWRGVAGGILPEALRLFAQLGFPVDECAVHMGPSICGRCYEVGVDVYEQLTGWQTTRPRNVDLRALLGEQANQLGVAKWSASGECTRCDNADLFSHRAGDAGRQIACIYSIAP